MENLVQTPKIQSRCTRCKQSFDYDGFLTCTSCRTRFKEWYYSKYKTGWIKELKISDPKEYDRKRKLQIKRNSLYQKTGKAKEIAKRHRVKMKEIVINHYGGKCVCCGETEINFLTMDHINNDGKQDRKEMRHQGGYIYRWIIRKHFPNDLRVLCWNCNMGRQINGGICPHRKELNDTISPTISQ